MVDLCTQENQCYQYNKNYPYLHQKDLSVSAADDLHYPRYTVDNRIIIYYLQCFGDSLISLESHLRALIASHLKVHTL